MELKPLYNYQYVSLMIKKQWEYTFNIKKEDLINIAPKINFCFFKDGTLSNEKSIVVQDRENIITVINKQKTSTGTLVSSIFFILKKKLQIVNASTGKVIVPFDIENHDEYIRKNYPNMHINWDLYAYHFNEQTSLYFHSTKPETSTERNRTYNEKISGLYGSKNTQMKEIYFGFALISYDSELLFNILNIPFDLFKKFQEILNDNNKAENVMTDIIIYKFTNLEGNEGINYLKSSGILKGY